MNQCKFRVNSRMLNGLWEAVNGRIVRIGVDTHEYFSLGNLVPADKGLEPRLAAAEEFNRCPLQSITGFYGHLREGGSHLIGQNCGDLATLWKAGGRAEHRPKSQVDLRTLAH